MDGWQQSVETRLGELRTDLRTVTSDIGTMKGDLASVKTRVEHLPGHGFIVAVVIGGMTLFAALIAFAPSFSAS